MKHVLILLGPPGAGKGSQATLLSKALSIAHISTGDLLRENIAKGTELGAQAKTRMDKGLLVEDELVFSMLFSRFESPDCQKGYILDGFPRNLAQATRLKKRLGEKETPVVINLSIEDNILIDRLTKRVICKGCQAPYHLLFAPPKRSGICDVCGSELYQRSDDTKEVIENRLKVYHKNTAPLIDFYEKEKLLISIDANQTQEAVCKEILERLKGKF